MLCMVLMGSGQGNRENETTGPVTSITETAIVPLPYVFFFFPLISVHPKTRHRTRLHGIRAVGQKTEQLGMIRRLRSPESVFAFLFFVFSLLRYQTRPKLSINNDRRLSRKTISNQKIGMKPVICGHLAFNPSRIVFRKT